MSILSLVQTRAFFYTNVVLFFFLINGVCSRTNYRLDLTQDQINSVSSSTKKVFESFEETVLIEAYISRAVTGEISSELQPILGILYEMERVGGRKLKLRVYNPDNEEERAKAQERGIRGISIAEQKDVEASVRLGFFGLYIQKGEDSVVLPLLDRSGFISDLEYRVLREIKRFGQSSTKSGIGIVKAPGSSEIRTWTRAEDQNKDNLYGFKVTLEKELGEVKEVELNARVPAQIHTLLLVGTPRLEAEEFYYLDQFLLRGNNLICMLGAFQFQISAGDPRMARFGMGGGSLGTARVGKEELEKINAWLGKYGLGLKGEILLEPSQPMPVWDFQGRFPRQIPYSAWAVYTRQTKNVIGKHPSLAPIEQMVFPWFSSLEVKEALQPKVKFQTLIQSSSQAISLPTLNLGYGEVQKASQGGQARLGYQAPIAVLAKGSFQSAYPSKREIPKGADRLLHLKEQLKESSSHFVLMGTPYLVSDILLRNQMGTSVFSLNRAFIFNLLEAVEGDTDLVAARSRQKTLSTLIVKSKLMKSVISWSFSLGLPLLLGIGGAVRLSRRGHKRGIVS